jgi:RNA recognition motif-containing protein
MSYFFTNFPDDVKAVDLWPRFAKFGWVGEVFIPAKVDKQGKRFGFVKFREVQDAKELLRMLSNIWIDSFKLRINLSKFGRRTEPRQSEVEQKKVVSEGSTEIRHGGGQIQTGKSFRGALLEEVGGTKIPVGVDERVCVVEKTKTEVVWEVEVDEERLMNLEGAYVGFLVDDREVQSLQNNLRMEGYQSVRVNVLRYRKILLWSDKAGEVKELLETVGWWCSLFEKVVSWSPELVANDRVTLLRCSTACMGDRFIPSIGLQVWSVYRSG